MISLENEEDPSRSIALDNLPSWTQLVFHGINALWLVVPPKITNCDL